MLKYILISFLISFSGSLWAISEEECAYAHHSTSAFDATDRAENDICSDGILAQTLPACSAASTSEESDPRPGIETR